MREIMKRGWLPSARSRLRQSVPNPPTLLSLVCAAHALTFAQVCSCVSRASSPTAILTALKAVARMVLGCWVLKRCAARCCWFELVSSHVVLCHRPSELYAKDRAVHVRDHILLQVMADDDHCVSRLDVCEQTRSRRADATNILKGPPPCHALLRAPALTPPLVLQEYVSLSLSDGSGSSSSSQTTRSLQSASVVPSVMHCEAFPDAHPCPQAPCPCGTARGRVEHHRNKRGEVL